MQKYVIMLEINETKFLFQHKSCECKFKLNENASNAQQKWNRKEYGKNYDWGSSKNDYM